MIISIYVVIILLVKSGMCHQNSLLLENILEKKALNQGMPLDSSGAIDVSIQVIIQCASQVLDKDDQFFLQVELLIRWKDIRLAWNPSLFDEQDSTAVSTQMIWTPPLYSETSLDYHDGFDRFSRGSAYISYDGSVLQHRQGKLNLYGNFDTTFFPRDSSYVQFRFMFWEIPSTVISIKYYQVPQDDHPVTFKNNKSELDSLQWKMSELVYSEKQIGQFRQLEIELKIKRLAGSISKLIIMPVCLQMLLTMSTFSFPLGVSYRINLTVENLIDILFFINISYTFVHVNQGNILSNFLFDCLNLTFFIVFVTILSQWYKRVYENIHKNDRDVIRNDDVVKTIQQIQRNSLNINTRIRKILLQDRLKSSAKIINSKNKQEDQSSSLQIRSINSISQKRNSIKKLVPLDFNHSRSIDRRSFLFDTFDGLEQSNESITKQQQSCTTNLKKKIIKTITQKDDNQKNIDSFYQEKLKFPIIPEQNENQISNNSNSISNAKSFNKLKTFMSKQNIENKDMYNKYKFTLGTGKSQNQINQKDNIDGNVKIKSPNMLSAVKNISKFTISLTQVKKRISNIFTIKQKTICQLQKQLQLKKFRILKYSILHYKSMDIILGGVVSSLSFLILFSTVWGNFQDLWDNF